MRVMTMPIFALALLAPVAAMAADSVGDLAGQVAAALGGADPAQFTKLFVAQPSITDTLGEFHWQGEAAAARYFAALQTAIREAGWENMTLTGIATPSILQTGEHAYASLPLAVNYRLHGAQKRDEGLLVLTFLHAPRGWATTSMTWVYTKPSG